MMCVVDGHNCEQELCPKYAKCLDEQIQYNYEEIQLELSDTRDPAFWMTCPHTQKRCYNDDNSCPWCDANPNNEIEEPELDAECVECTKLICDECKKGGY